MTYYVYWYRLDNLDGYFIWCTDDSSEGAEGDGVVLDDAGCLTSFSRLADLRAYAVHRGLVVEPGVNAEPLNLDAIRRWLRAARKNNVDCKTFLDAWNLFSDLASTVQGKIAHIDDQKEARIYDKLFWGNNLPALTPPGKFYEPIWTKSEVGRMWNVLNRGMQLFQGSLSKQNADTLPAQ